MQKLKNTENLAPGKVWPVFSLVRYLDKVAEAMVFMFSNTLTCDNAASVQAVKFMHNVSMCSITLEGDMYEPSGTISGGVVPMSQVCLCSHRSFMLWRSRLTPCEGCSRCLSIRR